MPPNKGEMYGWLKLSIDGAGKKIEGKMGSSVIFDDSDTK